MSHLDHFVGKVCTIFTQPISRNFKEESPATFPQQPFMYFVGVIDAVDSQGIMVTQPMTGLKSYFFRNALVAIAEEEVLDPENASDAAAIEEIKASNQEIRETMKKYEEKNEEFVDPNELKGMLNRIKNKPTQAK
jgi:hypothetical protein